MTTVFAAEVVDLLGKGLIFPLLSHIADIEVTWCNNVGYHHPLDDYDRGKKRMSERGKVVKKG